MIYTRKNLTDSQIEEANKECKLLLEELEATVRKKVKEGFFNASSYNSIPKYQGDVAYRELGCHIVNHEPHFGFQLFSGSTRKVMKLEDIEEPELIKKCQDHIKKYRLNYMVNG
jgi:hypothetical protein